MGPRVTGRASLKRIETGKISKLERDLIYVVVRC
jgi:hypothetical protein